MSLEPGDASLDGVEEALFLTWFQAFTDEYRLGEAEDVRRTDLKKDHSLRVYAEARELTAGLDIDPVLAGDVRLAALFHDLGRFPQYRRFKTFRDADSVNHALLSAAVLARTGVLAHLPASRRTLIRLAVVLHNRRYAPARFFGRGPRDPVLTAVLAVRDCDKLDILRVMLEHLDAPGEKDSVVVMGLANDPGRWTRDILDGVMSGHVADYAAMRFLNDFRMLLLSWIFDLRFAASRRAFFSRGFAEALVAGLPDAPETRPLTERIFQEDDGRDRLGPAGTEGR